MKHLCVDGRLYGASGIGTFLQTALRLILEQGRFRLTILCKKDDVSALEWLSARLIPMKSWIYSLKEQAEYIFKIPSCDLFWTPHFNIPLLPIRSKKRMATIFDVYHLAHFSSLSLPQKMYAKYMYSKACGLSDCVTTLSEFSKNEILKFVPKQPKKIVKLSQPFYFTPLPEQKRSLLLYVGNLKPHKNLSRLLKAYAHLQPKEPLYIVGKKEGLITSDAHLLKQVEQNDFLKRQVHFTGYVSDQELKTLYSKAKCFIFPSLYEGYGYPPLEAMASGCPVIASNLASIPEVCEDAALYMNPYSVDAIAKALETVLTNKVKKDELVAKGNALIQKLRVQKTQIVEVIDACCSDS